MGYIELRIFVCVCDRCRKRSQKKVAQDEPRKIPKGWKRVTVHGCGMTNYSRDEILCAKCNKIRKKVEKKEAEERKKRAG